MDIVNKLDPALRPIYLSMPQAVDEAIDLISFRNNMHEFIKDIMKSFSKNERVNTKIKFVQGASDNPDVKVKIYSPAAKRSSMPAIMFIHGGGFFLGFPEMNDITCEQFVDSLGCVVVSVDYRLSPENQYPAATDDCYTVLKWMFTSAKELSIDKKRIAVCGASSGGCLAAAISLMARDRKEIMPAFQLLIYPVLDHRHNNTCSNSITDTRTWNCNISKKSWKAYLGNTANGNVPAYASPAMANDLTGLPAAYFAVCELDILRDDAIDYAKRLYEAGVPAELHVFPGTYHAFDQSAPMTEVAIRFNTEILNAFKRVFNK